MPTLVVLAAGMGSRYGGLKQVEPVGPTGEALLDYAVFDAIRAGFGRVVFVIRRDFEAIFRERVGARYDGKVVVSYAFQGLDDLPPGFGPPSGREKPWGTGHAVWCARDVVREPFAVINADDFYGLDAYEKLAAFLRGTGAASLAKPCFALIGFRLAATLSEHGGVSRGLCTVRDGRLAALVERTDIRPEDVGPGRRYAGEEIASMNCWGFTPALFPLLGEALAAFLHARRNEPKAELYLPGAVSDLIAAGRAEAEVLAAGGSWFGVTYRDDRPRVAKAIAALVAAGTYPAKLF